MQSSQDLSERTPILRATLGGHLRVMRLDHWVKNVFVLPGMVVALSVSGGTQPPESLAAVVILGALAICLVSSSNYVINEVLDGPADARHPLKRSRPVPSGLVNVRLAYVQWIALMVAGVGLAAMVNLSLAVTAAALWIMGGVYNVRPVRSKDVPYIDVLTEAVNNPLRMLAGWYIIDPGVVIPISLLLSYWLAGAYFMAIKRYSELRHAADADWVAAYRPSLAYYTPQTLLISIMFYASASMLFLGAFITRYRLELILSFPLVALVMASYLALSFKPDSSAQAPEKLYREPVLMAAVVACSIVMILLLFFDLPLLHRIFVPTLPLASP